MSSHNILFLVVVPYGGQALVNILGNIVNYGNLGF